MSYASGHDVSGEKPFNYISDPCTSVHLFINSCDSTARLPDLPTNSYDVWIHLSAVTQSVLLQYT
jgi:hypothetical protein